MKHLEYLYVIAIFFVFLSLASVDIRSGFGQECETESILSILKCNDDNNNEEAEPSDEDDSDSDIPMILPFP